MKKKRLLIFLMIFSVALAWGSGVHAASARKTPAYGMFYKANELFREEKYPQALAQYEQVLALGLESGNLYYNIGNTYFKAGMLGEALSSYEQAKRLIPNDSDLKANTNFVESLRKNPVLESRLFWLLSMLQYFGSYFSLDMLTVIWSAAYWLLIMISIAAVLLVSYRASLKKYIISGGIFILFISGVLAVKIYDYHANTYAFVIEDVIDVKFAPALEATTYFKVYEGTRVTVIRQEGAWVRIKTPDGKVGWASRLALDKV